MAVAGTLALGAFVVAFLSTAADAVVTVEEALEAAKFRAVTTEALQAAAKAVEESAAKAAEELEPTVQAAARYLTN
jgi:hypothetical protein